MRIETLQMFIELVDLGSYSHVADKLDLTQPAVTMQIKALEEHFATKLVIKDKGKINLTPSGRVIYNRAKKILENWEIAENKVNHYAGTVFDDLKIGASTIPSVYLLPEKLANFSREFPQVKIIMETGDSRDIIEKLEKGEVDAGVIGFKLVAAKFKVKVIAEDLLVLIVPSANPLTEKDSISLNDLIDENILIREKGSGTRKAFMRGLDQVGINISGLNIKACLGSTEAVIAAVEAGLGISFISSLAARKAVDCKKVKQIKVEDFSISRNFYLTYHKAREDDLLIKGLDRCLK
ncbi:selenium metabolism-associated LysR family transcriptional regulator [Halocella sp. SP3-1]|uniref:selenium metabolism-associated LysR family transcriptional regulator n=1 Tax=Halocella sp. SP3-1 TaxID=2382161 RepID=UPI000F75FF75|nr:selenium metabolism-associated LysR family transcriptional regulator [Halocella sp. SP3-1]AZO94732.1 LysR family transcriptional regulator [Halocella sp. SP3-1]